MILFVQLIFVILLKIIRRCKYSVIISNEADFSVKDV